jgi:putative ABC transport system permease protein
MSAKQRPGSPGPWSRGLLRPSPTDAARAELEHHLNELRERLEAAGMSAEEARLEAKRRFGDPGTYGSHMERSTRRLGRKMSFQQAAFAARTSLFHSLRSLWRQPGFALGVIVTLGLGIGVNTTMFGILDRLFFQPPLHIANAGEVHRFAVRRDDLDEIFGGETIACPEFPHLPKARTLASAAAYGDVTEMTIGNGEGAGRADALEVTHELFDLLGVRPARGRFFDGSDDRKDAPLTAVVSAEYWQRALGGRPDVLEQTLEVAGKAYRIVGVAPKGFTGVGLEPVDLWLPLRAVHGDNPDLENRGSFWISSVVRLAPNVDAVAAEEELTALHRAGRAESVTNGQYAEGATVSLRPLILARGPDASPETKVAKWLGGVSLIVLLIACANVTNLLLARGARRRRETSLRVALGAGRARVMGLILTETAVLSLLGGALAVGLAAVGGAAVRRTLLPGVHFPASPVDPRLLTFTLVLSLIAGAAASVGPVVDFTRGRLAGELSASAGTSRRRSRMRLVLTAAQAALAVVLLTGAGLFAKSLAAVRALDLGMDVDKLAIVRLELTTPGGANQAYARALEALRAMPGVETATATNTPFGWSFGMQVEAEGWDSLPGVGQGGSPPYHYVAKDYFETLGLAMREGRALGPTDGANDARVAVVNETMARALWKDGALGKCIYLGSGSPNAAAEARQRGECTQVVGVVENATGGSLEGDPQMVYYLPIAQAMPGRLVVRALYVRAKGDPSELAAAAAPVLRSVDPAVRFATVQPLRDLIDPQARSWRLGAALFTGFGLLALLVAAVGLYSVLAFDVAQSTREIGIRTALGAERSRLLGWVVTRGVGVAVLGIVAGVVAAYEAAPLAADLLFHVSPRDPSVLGAVAGILVVVAAAASLIPGIRATKVDALEALKTD